MSIEFDKSLALLEQARMRRSCRQFLPEALDMEAVKNCILTGASAPNGADKQPWHFSVVVDPEMKQKIREKAEEIEKAFYEKISDSWQADLDKLSVTWQKPFLTEAPCLIVIFKENYKVLDDGSLDKNYYVTESVGLATGMLINALWNIGYSSLTYTPAPMGFLSELLARPQGETPMMVLAVGKKDPEYVLPQLVKKSFDEIATVI